jgi:hypothetical protein
LISVGEFVKESRVRISRILLFAICFSVAYSLGQKGTFSPEASNVVGNVYSNSYFGFSYRIPTGMTSNLGTFRRRIKAGEHERTYVLLSAFSSVPPSKARPGVVIMADEASPYGGLKDGAAYLKRITGTMIAQGWSVSGRPSERAFGGKKFFRADYEKLGGPFPVYEASVCTVLKGYALDFVFSSGSESGIESQVLSLNTLQFTDSNH